MLPILHCCLALSLLLSPKSFQWFASFCLIESYITLPDGHPRVRKSLTHSSIVTCPLHSTHYTRTHCYTVYLEPDDDVILLLEHLELLQQLVQLHHRLAVLLRQGAADNKERQSNDII